MNTYWISLPCDLLSSLASFQCSLLHHLHLSSDLGLSKYVNQHSHLNLSRNVRLSVLYDLDFNTGVLLTKRRHPVKDLPVAKQWFKLASMVVVVGSHQVPFPMCTLETLQKYCSTSSLLLTFC